MAMLFYYLVTVGWRIFSATWTSLAHIWSRGSARCNQFGAHKIYCAKKKKLFRVLMSVSCDWHSVDGRGAVEYDTKHRCCKKINPLRMTYVCVRECFEATTTTSRQCQCDAIRRQVPFTYIKYVWNGNGERNYVGRQDRKKKLMTKQNNAWYLLRLDQPIDTVIPSYMNIRIKFVVDIEEQLLFWGFMTRTYEQILYYSVNGNKNKKTNKHNSIFQISRIFLGCIYALCVDCTLCLFQVTGDGSMLSHSMSFSPKIYSHIHMKSFIQHII